MAAVAGGRKPFDGNGSPLLPSPAAANLAAAAAGVLPPHAAAVSMLARLPGASGILPPSNYLNQSAAFAASTAHYRHPLLPGLPAGLGALAAAGNPYQSASFHTLLAGLSAQRQKLTENTNLLPEYQSLLSAALPASAQPPPVSDTSLSPPTNGAPVSPKEGIEGNKANSVEQPGNRSPISASPNSTSPQIKMPPKSELSPKPTEFEAVERRMESIANLKLKAEEHKMKIENGQKLEV